MFIIVKKKGRKKYFSKNYARCSVPDKIKMIKKEINESALNFITWHREILISLAMHIIGKNYNWYLTIWQKRDIFRNVFSKRTRREYEKVEILRTSLVFVMNSDVQTSLNEIVFSASTKITSRLHVTTYTQQTFTCTIKQKLISHLFNIIGFSSIIEFNWRQLYEKHSRQFK